MVMVEATMEVLAAVEPALIVEAPELTATAEKVLTAERCASNLGAVAIVCVGCPMLELCRFKNEAIQAAQSQAWAQESPPIFEVANDLSVVEGMTGLTYVSESTSTEVATVIATVSAAEHTGNIQSNPNVAPTSTRPSYREQLLDDTVNFVVAGSLFAPDEAVVLEVGDSSAPDALVLPATVRVVSSGEVAIEVEREASVLVTTLPDSPQETFSQIEVQAPSVISVDIITPVTAQETVLVVPMNLSQPEQVIVDSRPSEVVAAPRVVSKQRAIPVAVTSDEYVVVKTTMTEVAPPPLMTEKVVVHSEAVVDVVGTLPVFEITEPFEPHFVEDIPEVVTVAIDVVTISDETKTIIPRDKDPLVEYIQIMNSSDTATAMSRFNQIDKIKEATVTTLRVIAAPLIGSDSIDPELRLSDTTSVQQQAIAVLRQLALRALRAVALKLI